MRTIPNVRAFIALARPKHWVKNVFVLAPVVFAESAHSMESAWTALIAFACFCLLSSAVYAFNDILDASRDRLHPQNRNRPVASGAISCAAASSFAVAIILLSFTIQSLTLPSLFSLIGLAYLLNNVAYTLGLKAHALVDVLSISGGFVLRLLAGSAAIGVEASPWLLVCGFSLALFLGFGKRRAEVVMTDVNVGYRPTLITYSVPKLDVLLAITATITIVTYMLYTVSPDTVKLHQTEKLIYSVPFVIYGIFRFLFKVQEGASGGPVGILFSDPAFLVNGIFWLATIGVILKIR